MTGWSDLKIWFHKTFPGIPEGLKDDFQIEVRSENAKRIKILGGIFIFSSLALLLFPPSSDLRETQLDQNLYLILNSALFALSGLLFLWASLCQKGVINWPDWIMKTVVDVSIVCLILWSSWMTNQEIHEGINDWYFLGTVFLVYSLLLLSLAEVVVVSAIIVIGQFWFPALNIDYIIESGGLFLTLITAASVSRVLYYSRIRNFLNWENINHMNMTLKREVGLHMRTTEELEQIRQELNKKVHRQTQHLRDANQRLSEEIAERRYADKVRGILYRISTFVNKNTELASVFDYIHSQLATIMEVRNFFVGQFQEQDYSIQTLFEKCESDREKERAGARSLSAYLIRQKKPLLLDSRAIQELIRLSEIDQPDVLANSWLGVPLFVDDSLIGVLVAKSFNKNLEYDQTDLELLEYVSEHLALAIARKSGEERLIGAKEKAEESDRLKSSFLANLSHEIRTPMNAIVGFAELIGGQDLTAEERAYFSDQVIDNSNYLLKLISNIIELSKVQSGQIRVKPSQNLVGESMEQLLPSFLELRRTLKKDQLEIKLELEEEVKNLKFSADPERFRQIMYCLIENAVKFTNEGGVYIRVQSFDRNRLQFSVRDTGIGMDEEETKQIFEWFRQGARASEKLYRGMGLGLTLAQLLIEVMDGKIWVETELGAGSCFYFTLPLSRGIAALELPNPQKNSADNLNPTNDQASAG